MADNNTERIDDLVDPEALKQLQALETELEKAYNQMVKLLKPAQDLEKALSKSAITYKALVDAINRYETLSKQINVTQNQTIQTLRQIDSVRNRVANSNSNEVRELIRYGQELSQNRRRIQNEIAIERAHEGSLNQLRATLRLLTIQWDEMGKEARESLEGQELLQRLRLVRGEVGSLERLTGRSQRDVGSYTESIVRAFNQITSGNFRQGFSSLGSLFGNTLAVFGGNLLTKAVDGIKAFIGSVREFVSESIDLAAKAEGVNTAFEKLNKPGLLDNLRKETKGTVNDLQLMQASVRAKNFQIPLNRLGSLLKFAQQRAQETGESVDYLTDSIINGIGRKSSLILDNLGISASRLQAEFKKTGDFATATFNIVNQELEKQGTLALTSADKAQIANVKVQNAQLKVGNQLLWVNDLWSKIKSSSADALSQAADTLLPALNAWLEKAINKIIDLWNTFDGLRKVILYVIAVVETLQDFFNYTIISTISGFKNLTNIIIDSAGIIGKVVDGIKKGLDFTDVDFSRLKKSFNTTVDDLGKNSDILTRKIAKNFANAEIQASKSVARINLTNRVKGETFIPTDDGEDSNNTGDKNVDKRIEAEKKAIQDLEEFRIKQVVDANKTLLSDSKVSYEERIGYLEEYVAYSKNLIEEQAKNQISNLKKGEMTEKAYQASVTLINAKAAAERIKIDQEATKARETINKDYADQLMKDLKANVSLQAQAISRAEEEALDVAELAYLNKELSARDYETERTRIVRKAALDRMQVEMDAVKELMNTENLTADQRKDLNQKLLDAELAYQQYINKEIVKDQKNTAKQQEEIEKRLAEKRKELLTEALTLFSTFFSAQTERQLAAIDKESEANDEYYSDQEDKIDRLAESGAISDEQAEARKAALAEQQKKREAELEERRKEINQRQAKFEKAQSIATIGINTASAIMKNTAQLGFLAAIPVNLLTAALGAAQIATVLATPIPEYAKGTDFHEGGPAVVGDGGRSELVVTPDGKMYKTPSHSVLVDLPKGSEVMPDFHKAVANISLQQMATPFVENKTIVIAENERQLSAIDKTNSLITNLITSQNKTSRSMSYNLRINSLKR
ncbi:hypothetical protein [Dysgonomonas macrotermitis]|uniref:Uncharacterized protein n=1 Tax=Dysgonomonas macrotermitis TaxID=1346286 RepID=A0A1M5C621_9BACT|nr:hypothetical protein [Dysgonomonas macrotermitis]SHF50057.1 hypothetical protein SAMN05444362_10740 [Dysgonomonas macrotermitis]